MELYDQQADPNEWKNIAADPKMSSVVEKLTSRMPHVNAEPSKYNKYPTNEYFLAK